MPGTFVDLTTWATASTWKNCRSPRLSSLTLAAAGLSSDVLDHAANATAVATRTKNRAMGYSSYLMCLSLPLLFFKVCMSSGLSPLKTLSYVPSPDAQCSVHCGMSHKATIPSWEATVIYFLRQLAVGTSTWRVIIADRERLGENSHRSNFEPPQPHQLTNPVHLSLGAVDKRQGVIGARRLQQIVPTPRLERRRRVVGENVLGRKPTARRVRNYTRKQAWNNLRSP